MKLCVAEEENEDGFQATCPSEKSNRTKLDVIVRSRRKQVEHLIKYLCYFDQCNGEEIFRKVKMMVDIYSKDLTRFLDLPEVATRRSTLYPYQTRSTQKMTKAIIRNAGWSFPIIIYVIMWNLWKRFFA